MQVWTAITIKSLDTAKRWLKGIALGCEGVYVTTAPTYDYWFENTKNGFFCYSRHKDQRGNIFNPYCEVWYDGMTASESAVKAAYVLRKYINKELNK